MDPYIHEFGENCLFSVYSTFDFRSTLFASHFVVGNFCGLRRSHWSRMIRFLCISNISFPTFPLYVPFLYCLNDWIPSGRLSPSFQYVSFNSLESPQRRESGLIRNLTNSNVYD